MSRFIATGRLRRLLRTGNAACLEHRAALLALVERAPADRPGQGALDHLERCGRCRAEVGAERLAGFALERALQDARAAVPSSDGWSSLRARLERRPATAGRSASPIVALALGMGITVALILPAALPRWSPTVTQEATPEFVVVPDGTRPGAGVSELGAVPQVAAPGAPAEVQPVSADPVSSPRRPLAGVGSTRVDVTNPGDAPGRTALFDQDPRQVRQTVYGVSPGPLSAPKRFTVV